MDNQLDALAMFETRWPMPLAIRERLTEERSCNPALPVSPWADTAALFRSHVVAWQSTSR